MARALYLILGGCFIFGCSAAAEELDDIRKEPDPLRRFERFIEFADSSLKEARDLANGGNGAKVPAVLGRMADATELSLQALRDTGKRPGKLARQYKKGEMKSRDFVRRIESLIAAMNFDDRAPAEPFKTRMMATHEEFLLGVMSR